MNSFYTKAEVEQQKAKARAEWAEEHPNEQESDTEPSWHIWGNDEEGWYIWLNPSAEPDTGLCIIADGKTKHDAIERAVGTLHEAIHTLRRML